MQSIAPNRSVIQHAAVNNLSNKFTLTTSTLIDALFTNDHDSHLMTGVYDTALSDHYLIYTVFSKSFVRKNVHIKKYSLEITEKFHPKSLEKSYWKTIP